MTHRKSRSKSNRITAVVRKKKGGGSTTTYKRDGKAFRVKSRVVKSKSKSKSRSRRKKTPTPNINTPSGPAFAPPPVPKELTTNPFAEMKPVQGNGLVNKQVVPGSTPESQGFVKGTGGLYSQPSSLLDKVIGTAGQQYKLDEKSGELIPVFASTPPAIGKAGKAIAAGIKAVTGKTAVKASKKIGVIKTITTKNLKTGTVRTVQVNTVTEALTETWLSKFIRVGKTVAISGALLGAIGSYPFSGFIKEEALQTLGFGVNAAYWNDDIEGGIKAMDFQEEILNPTLWDKIIQGVPYANVVATLKDFYESATIKLEIDRKVFGDLKTKIDNGESDTDMYARIAQERVDAKEAERASDEEYYQGIADRKREAKAAERKADEEYWDKILRDKPEADRKKRKYDDDYWSAYYKSLAKYRDNSRPSNLKFGLL